jgi:hypothetical protein
VSFRASALGLVLFFGAAVALARSPAATRVRAASAGSLSAPEAAYVESLVARATSLGLHRDEMWLRLVHYRPTLFGAQQSEADARSFFLAEDGRNDPRAELAATLRGFFGPEPSDPRLPHPFCRFPARLAWLNSRLAFDFERAPRRVCPDFQDYLKKLNARSLSLVFSSYYLNNPASAFGHTFLRVDKATRAGQDEGLELLDYGVDFSATVDTGNPLLYAFKGLLGMFPGVFRKVPYYIKVREYNDYESRDLWEYQLKLSPAELNMVLAHLWELGWTYFDYYYLSENCSYYILAALEVANPRFQLLEDLGWPVIPADTVKAVDSEPGLVQSVHYRPSNRAQARARIARLSTQERDALADLIDDEGEKAIAGLEGQQKARVLDAALDLVDFRYARDLVRGPDEQPDPDGARLKQQLLEARARLLLESEDLRLEPPFRKMPHIGHDSSRIGLGSGHLQERGYFYSLDLRLALHDLADPSAGYPDEAAIEFLPLRFRYYLEDRTFSLEEISLIRVTSLTPLERFLKKWSWSMSAGARRIRDEGCAGCLAATGEFGAGIALAPFGDAMLAWLFADAELLAPVEGGFFDAFRAGVGPKAGLRLRFSDNLTLLGSGSLHWLPEQEPQTTWDAQGVLRWYYTRDFALSADARLQPDALTLQAFSHIYF